MLTVYDLVGYVCRWLACRRLRSGPPMRYESVYPCTITTSRGRATGVTFVRTSATGPGAAASGQSEPQDRVDGSQPGVLPITRRLAGASVVLHTKTQSAPGVLLDHSCGAHIEIEWNRALSLKRVALSTVDGTVRMRGRRGQGRGAGVQAIPHRPRRVSTPPPREAEAPLREVRSRTLYDPSSDR